MINRSFILRRKAKTWFDGIALEPHQHIEEFIKQLDKKGIAHDTIQPNTWTNDKGVLTGWSTLGLQNLLPEESNLFICDFNDNRCTRRGSHLQK